MYIEMSDKVNLYLNHSGEGTPCIFIHGGPGEGSLDFEVLGGNSLERIIEDMEDSFKSQIYYGTKLLSEYELKSTTYNSNLEEWQYVKVSKYIF